MALVRARRLKLWKTKPSRSLRMRARSGSLQRRDIDAFEQVMAAGRPVEAAENIHQRRFARARRAHNGDELAAPATVRLTPRSASTSTSPTTKVRVTFSTLMTGCACCGRSCGIGRPI